MDRPVPAYLVWKRNDSTEPFFWCSHSQGGPSGSPGHGIAGRHELQKNTGSQGAPVLILLVGRPWREAWEDTHVMQMRAQADAQ